MKRAEFILKAMTVFCVCLMLWTPMTVKADLILEPIEEELTVNDMEEEKITDAAFAGVGVTALVAATGTMIAVIFKKKKNDEGEE